jgi:hypothetical protein
MPEQSTILGLAVYVAEEKKISDRIKVAQGLTPYIKEVTRQIDRYDKFVLLATLTIYGPEKGRTTCMHAHLAGTSSSAAAARWLPRTTSRNHRRPRNPSAARWRTDRRRLHSQDPPSSRRRAVARAATPTSRRTPPSTMPRCRRDPAR